MGDGPSATHTLGLEHEGTHVRGVELCYLKRQIVCYRMFVLDGRAEDEDVKPLYMSEHGKALEESARHSLVVTGIDAAHTVIRQIDVKLKKEKDIDAVLGFQAEPYLPFPIEEAYLAKSVIATHEDGTALTLLAVREDHLKQHIESWVTLGVDPEVVSSIPYALSTFAASIIVLEDPVVFFHIGFLYTTCALVQKGKLLAAQSFKGGIHDLAHAFIKDRGVDPGEKEEGQWLTGLDFLQLDAKELPLLSNAILQIQREAVRAAFGMAKYAHVGDVEGLLFTGEGSHYSSLGQAISKAIGKPILSLEVPLSLSLTEEEARYYAVPIGLALTALPGATEQINFRQKDLAYPHPWKRLRMPIASYIALCGLLALCTYLFGQAYLGLKEDTIRQNYVSLVAGLKKDYNEVEKKNESTAGLEQSSGNAISPKSLSMDQINSRLDKLEIEVAAAPNTIALFPNTPKVSDILAWLGSHPQITMSDDSDNSSTQIHIDLFNYKMIKRPELTKPREKYQVQVEIDFSTSSPRAARLFYDSLIAPNDFVDPKVEVKWTATSGKYRVSFFLKDKTIYPNP